MSKFDRRSFVAMLGTSLAARGAAVSPYFGEHAAALSGLLGSDKAIPDKRPNILYIHSHDTGRYTSPYGHSVPTPNLKRLAGEGVLFRQAFCAAPSCSPSRASLLTGECSHSNGMLGLVNRGFAMTPEGYQHHIVRTLRNKAGYYSALIGLEHIARDPHIIGYDYVNSPIKKPGIPGANHVEEVTPVAVDFIKSQARARQPFWLTVGYFETHRPYNEPGPLDDPRYIRPPDPLPDTPATRHDMAKFHAAVRRLDWGVGRVLEALEAEELAENTLVISTTDHGIPFPDMKTCLYDAGAGVHLVMRGPGGFRGGQVCDAMISQIDIFPTICDVVEIDHPEWLQGKSFLPVMRNQKQEINAEIFAELNYHASYAPKRSVRTKRWKYIRHFSDYIHPVLPNCDDGLSKTYWMDNGWAKQTVAREELFDLIFDPNERNSLVGDPSHEVILKEMRQKLQGWMEATSDPLLVGPVKAPYGATFNPPTEISPGDPTITVS